MNYEPILARITVIKHDSQPLLPSISIINFKSWLCMLNIVEHCRPLSSMINYHDCFHYENFVTITRLATSISSIIQNRENTQVWLSSMTSFLVCSLNADQSWLTTVMHRSLLIHELSYPLSFGTSHGKPRQATASHGHPLVYIKKPWEPFWRSVNGCQDSRQLWFRVERLLSPMNWSCFITSWWFDSHVSFISPSVNMFLKLITSYFSSGLKPPTRSLNLIINHADWWCLMMIVVTTGSWPPFSQMVATISHHWWPWLTMTFWSLTITKH